MKKLSSLFGWLLLAGVASAAPYIVYSGSTQETVVTPSGSALKTFEVYLITDLADTTSYGILQFDAVTRQGEITIYPIANPTSVEANLNLFGSVDAAGGIGGTAVLGIGDITTDSSSNTYVSHSYATGLLTTQSTLLVPARTNTLTTGTLTFPPSTAIYSGDQPFAQTFQGTTLSYTISSTGSLTQATGQGLFSLQIDPFLTPAANIGAGNPSSLPQKAVRSTQIITPTDLVNGPITPVSTADTTVLVAYDNWLTNLATALNVTLPSTNENVGGDDGGGASLTFGGTGTGILTGGNSYEGGTIIGGGTLNIYGNTGGGLTVIGVPTTTNGGTLTVGGGTITSSGTETLTLTGTSTFTGPDHYHRRHDSHRWLGHPLDRKPHTQHGQPKRHDQSVHSHQRRRRHGRSQPRADLQHHRRHRDHLLH